MLAALSIRRPERRAVILLIIILLIVGGLAVVGWERPVSLESIIRYRATIADFVAAHYTAALVGYIATYAAVAGLAVPGIMFLTMGGGVFFGGVLGGIAALIGATIAATVVFLVGKVVLRDRLSRWMKPQMMRLAQGFRENAFNYLLFLRLLPIFPFTLGNLLPAVCNVRLATFVIATFLGIAPMTLAFALFGAGIDRMLAGQIDNYRACVAAGMTGCRIGFDIRLVVTPELAVGLIALGIAALLPVIVRRFGTSGIQSKI